MANDVYTMDGNFQVNAGYSIPPVNGVWTPLWDGNGNVTDASIRSLPIATLQNPQVFRVEGFAPTESLTQELADRGFDVATKSFGTASVGPCFHAWNGMAYDEQTKQGWLPHTGGHADSSLNGVIQIDFNKFEASWHLLPSDPDRPGFVWSQNYRGLVRSPATFVDGISWDGTRDYSVEPAKHTSFTEYIDENGAFQESLPDGRPGSMHIYNGVGISNGIVFTSRNRNHQYDTNSRQYTRQVWNRDGQIFYPSINNSFVRHDATGNFFGNFSATNRPNISKLEPSNLNEILSVTGRPSGIGQESNSVFFRKGADVMVMYTQSQGKYIEFNMATETWGAVQTINNHPVNVLPPPRTAYWYTHEMMPMVYIEEWGSQGSFLLHFTWSGNDSDGVPLRDTWWRIDLATNNMSRIDLLNYPQNEDGTANHGHLTGNKFVVTEIQGCKVAVYIWARVDESAVYIMRLT